MTTKTEDTKLNEKLIVVRRASPIPWQEIIVGVQPATEVSRQNSSDKFFQLFVSRVVLKFVYDRKNSTILHFTVVVVAVRSHGLVSSQIYLISVRFFSSIKALFDSFLKPTRKMAASGNPVRQAVDLDNLIQEYMHFEKVCLKRKNAISRLL